jgi:hypothetical protein
MGEDIRLGVTYDEGNKYEREATKEVNKALVGSNAERRSMRLWGIPASIRTAADQIGPVTRQDRLDMERIIEVCSRQHVDWGFKDPRTCLTYSDWAAHLPAHRIIAVYRPLHEMWQHYRPKGILRQYRTPGIAWHVVRAWCEHNASILEHLADTSAQFVVLEYGRLVRSQAEFERLERFVGRVLDDRRKPELYRSRSAKGIGTLSLFSYLVQRRYGYDHKRIEAQLEALRQESVPG